MLSDYKSDVLSEKPKVNNPTRTRKVSPPKPKRSKSPQKPRVYNPSTQDQFWKTRSDDTFSNLYNEILSKNQGDKLRAMDEIETMRKQGILQQVLSANRYHLGEMI